MLRRKLLLILGTLVALLLLAAIAAILTFQGVLAELDGMTAAAAPDVAGNDNAGAVRELEALVDRFRLLLLGLGLLFLVVINVAMVVLIRAAAMILRPVSALVDGSQRLAREEFGHRIELASRDEFGELAAAYNALASQLQLNEQRKIETLQQVARTLNHELNNALAIIDLQLAQIERADRARRDLETPLRQIHETLRRINRTVEALKRVRRIVLTDYTSGVKMLDLERSLDADSSAPAGTLPPAAGISAP